MQKTEKMTGELVVKNLGHLIIKDTNGREVKNANEKPAFPANDYAGTGMMQELIRFLAFNGTLASKNLITLRYGIKFKNTELRLKLNAMMRGSNASFDTTGQKQLEITPYVLQPIQYEFKQKFDFTDLVKTWVAEAGAGFAPGIAQNRLIPQIMMTGLMDEMLEQFPLFHDQLYLVGKTTTANDNRNTYGALSTLTDEYKGYITLLKEGEGQQLTTPTSAITAVAITGANEIQITVAGLDINAGDFIEIDGIVNGGGGNIALLNRRRYKENADAVSVKYATALQVKSAVTSGANRVCVLNIDTTDFTTPGGASVTVTVGTPNLANAKVCFINENNVSNILLNFWLSLTQVQRSDPNFKIWANPAFDNAIRVSEAQRLGGSIMNAIYREKSLLIDEKLVVVDNMPVGCLIGISNDNAEAGVDDTLESFNTLQMIDSFETTFEKFILFYAGFATCVGVKKTKETIISTPF